MNIEIDPLKIKTQRLEAEFNLLIREFDSLKSEIKSLLDLPFNADSGEKTFAEIDQKNKLLEEIHTKLRENFEQQFGKNTKAKPLELR